MQACIWKFANDLLESTNSHLMVFFRAVSREVDDLVAIAALEVARRHRAVICMPDDADRSSAIAFNYICFLLFR
ncbi:hypothetical protein ATN84_24720 [Paramesorhizobium deserti]|uniref:Uncharacterized protein n=1 Tax=Paramesorhizobium deserti TaxID=1494590 RepID=A0A135HXN9_9HYPH|nr:hypothetical protein ATN84_24720 [Paramesorhizobium deserti]